MWNPNELITTRNDLVSRGQSLQGDRPGATMHRTKVALPSLRLLSELIRIDIDDEATNLPFWKTRRMVRGSKSGETCEDFDVIDDRSSIICYDKDL